MANLDVNIYAPEALENIATDILRDFDISHIAIDITLLASRLGLNVYCTEFYNNEHISGYIKYDNGNKNIYVNRKHPITRQRFTIAHEIAHYILHRDLLDSEGGTPLFRGNDGNRVEAQADRLGAALLMPRHAVNALLTNNGNIYSLASVFNVSPAAMYNRLTDLGLN